MNSHCLHFSRVKYNIFFPNSVLIQPACQGRNCESSTGAILFLNRVSQRQFVVSLSSEEREAVGTSPFLTIHVPRHLKHKQLLHKNRDLRTRILRLLL
jgi:hypothetical protein